MGVRASGPGSLAFFRDRPAEAGVFSDFDGTLAPIVDDPAQAAPYPGAVDALAALAARMGRVGVVSGRPASFLAAQLGGRGIELWGLYGLETVGPGGAVVPFGPVEAWRATVDRLVSQARAELGAGVGVEHKGVTLTLHFRTSPSSGPAVRRWAEAAAAGSGLAVHEARMSYELRPVVARDKGTVVAELAAGLGAACFVGDDAGDLSAFDALDRLAAAGVHALRVGVRSAEAPPELLARADVVVDGPAGVVALLSSWAADGP